jgi:hypothetical protein
LISWTGCPATHRSKTLAVTPPISQAQTISQAEPFNAGICLHHDHRPVRSPIVNTYAL